MKKQTKLFTTLSAAALLTIGVSAVSMAAGWDNSTGEWRYLDNDGSEVTDTWKSANGNWFYLNSDGVMATNQLIEDNNNSKTRYYYVDQYGAMVKNSWKAVALDDNGADLDAEYYWYYFGSDGKAYTAEAPLTTSKIKTIGPNKYAFDSEGHMLYGWIDEDNMEQQDEDENAWKSSEYYFNGWNDGHMQTGWIQLAVKDVDNEDDESQTYWFNFKSSGKKRNKRAKINGTYYYFDNSDGHMLTDWSTASESVKKAGGATASELVYLNGDGSMRKNKWVWAIPDEKYLEDDYNDDEYSWWYFNNSGKLVTDQIKKINGKKYAFDEHGRMQYQFVSTDANGHTVTDSGKTEDWTRDMWVNGVTEDGKKSLGTDVYYFSGSEESDGSMKKGYQSLALDDSTYQFYFNTSNGKAEGYTTADQKRHDDAVDAGRTLNNVKAAYVSKIKKYANRGLVLAPTSDDESNYAAVGFNSDDKLDLLFKDATVGNIMVNKSGTVVKNKTKLKDSNDAYYIVSKNGVVLAYYESEDAYDSATSVEVNGKTKKVKVADLLGTDSPSTFETKLAAALAKL